jgi:photosynthetic reaction center cytochrome c subunit
LKLGIAMLALCCALFAQQPPPGPKPDRPKAQPKNLKLITAEEVRPMMGAFRRGLGVECSFCHVQGDFASDENPKKEMARKMITLVRDVNAKFPDGKGKVTCFTCHRGAQEPVNAPPQQ